MLLELTNPDAVYQNMHDAIAHGVRPVVGTSGLSFGNIEELTAFSKEMKVGG